MNNQSENLLVFHNVQYNNSEKLELLNKLINGQPSTDNLFQYYSDRVQIYFDMHEYEAALNDINSMEQMKEVQDHIKVLKWKSLIQIYFATIREEIKTSLSVKGNDRGQIGLLHRINEDNILKFLEDNEKLNKRKRKHD